MKIGPFFRRICGIAAAVAVVGACAADPPETSSPTPSSVAKPTPSVVDPSSVQPNDLTEAAVRGDVESQWVKFWIAYRDIIRTPDGEREALLAQVAESPLKDQILEIARTSEAEGIDNYGTVIHSISWDSSSIDGAAAELSDCQDDSSTGAMNLHTGEVISRGQARANFRGWLARGSDGVWRVTRLVSQGVGEC